MSDSPFNVDKIVFEYLKTIKNGFYIEAGANNGIWQSNTLMLQNIGWKGILIEPNFYMFQSCVSNRPFNYYFNCALVDSDYKEETIDGFFNKTDYENSLCGQISHDLNTHCCPERWTKEKPIPVKAMTLETILKNLNLNKKIDFLSLDVEGYEINALNGLNLRVNRPKYVLLESSSDEKRRKELYEYMIKFNYEFIGQITVNDQLYKER
jgi:FkbM family methyltransferase